VNHDVANYHIFAGMHFYVWQMTNEQYIESHVLSQNTPFTAMAILPS